MRHRLSVIQFNLSGVLNGVVGRPFVLDKWFEMVAFTALQVGVGFGFGAFFEGHDGRFFGMVRGEKHILLTFIFSYLKRLLHR